MDTGTGSLEKIIGKEELSINGFIKIVAPRFFAVFVLAGEVHMMTATERWEISRQHLRARRVCIFGYEVFILHRGLRIKKLFFFSREELGEIGVLDPTANSMDEEDFHFFLWLTNLFSSERRMENFIRNNSK